MASSDGGKGNFSDTGGYGGNFNSSGGGLNNRSGSMGGNPTNWSGGVGNFGASQAAASRLGQPASSMNAAANQAMVSAGYVLGPNGTWQASPTAGRKFSESTPGPMPQPKPIPQTIVQNPIAPLPPSVQPPVPGEVDPRIPSLWEGYNPITPMMSRPNFNYNSWASGGIGIGGPGSGPGTMPSLGQPGTGGFTGGFGSNLGGTDFGEHSGSYGNVGAMNPNGLRGLANGGFANPGETVMVGERGPELMQAGMGGAAVQPMRMNGPMGSSPSNDLNGFGALLNAITQRQRGGDNRFQNPLNNPQAGAMPTQFQGGGKGNFGGMGRATGGGWTNMGGGWEGRGY